MRIGIEGTSSYGAGFTRAAQAAGCDVVEVSRAIKSTRRLKGKSDRIDSYCAARTALAGQGLAAPKDDKTAGLRALHIARRSAVKSRTTAINQIKALLVVAPCEMREKYRDLRNSVLIESLSLCRPAGCADPTTRLQLIACKQLARRVKFLTEQIDELATEIEQQVRAANPALLAAFGLGSDTAAQLLITAGLNPDRLRSEAAFAALCGTAPVPVSSGKTHRLRLSRGGDRAANSALHCVAVVRMAKHQPTRAYVEKQRALGRSNPEILRRLKRAIVREVFKLLTRTTAVPEYADLRPARQAKNITITAAARQFGVWPAAISRIERGASRDDEFASTYREWLAAA